MRLTALAAILALPAQILAFEFEQPSSSQIWNLTDPSLITWTWNSSDSSIFNLYLIDTATKGNYTVATEVSTFWTNLSMTPISQEYTSSMGYVVYFQASFPNGEIVPSEQFAQVGGSGMGTILPSSTTPPASTATSSTHSTTETSTTLSTPTISTPTASSTAQISNSTATITPAPHGLSNSAKAGIGIGVSLAVIAALAAAFLLLRHRRPRSRQQTILAQPGQLFGRTSRNPTTKSSGTTGTFKTHYTTESGTETDTGTATHKSELPGSAGFTTFDTSEKPELDPTPISTLQADQYQQHLTSSFHTDFLEPSLVELPDSHVQVPWFPSIPPQAELATVNSPSVKSPGEFSFVASPLVPKPLVVRNVVPGHSGVVDEKIEDQEAPLPS